VSMPVVNVTPRAVFVRPTKSRRQRGRLGPPLTKVPGFSSNSRMFRPEIAVPLYERLYGHSTDRRVSLLRTKVYGLTMQSNRIRRRIFRE